MIQALKHSRFTLTRKAYIKYNNNKASQALLSVISNKELHPVSGNLSFALGVINGAIHTDTISRFRRLSAF